MSSHTPAPYHTSTPHAGEDIFIYDAAMDRIAIVRGKDVAFSTAKANAALFRAAPELLVALKELELRTRQFIAGELVTFPAALLPQVRALIADAKGGVA